MTLRVFPVQGSHHFTDDFHVVKPSGRLHQGNDIFAAAETPVVAVDDGYLTDASNPMGGVSFNLKTPSDQMRVYGAHLTRFEGGLPRSVSAGDVIGYVGTSGNAQGTSPHLHFEVHPLGGAAVDPYPYLKAAESGTVFVPPKPTSPWWAALGILGLAGAVALVVRR